MEDAGTYAAAAMPLSTARNTANDIQADEHMLSEFEHQANQRW